MTRPGVWVWQGPRQRVAVLSAAATLAAQMSVAAALTLAFPEAWPAARVAAIVTAGFLVFDIAATFLAARAPAWPATTPNTPEGP